MATKFSSGGVPLTPEQRLQLAQNPGLGVMLGTSQQNEAVLRAAGYVTVAEQTARKLAAARGDYVFAPDADLANCFQDTAATLKAGLNAPIRAIREWLGRVTATAAGSTAPLAVQIANGQWGLSYDGIDDVILTGIPMGSAGALIVAVYNLNLGGAAQRNLAGTGATTNTTVGVRMFLDTTNVFGGQVSDGTARTATGSGTFTAGRGVGAITWDLTAAKGYFNGVLGTNNANSRNGAAAAGLQLGASLSSGYCDRVIAGFVYCPTMPSDADLAVYQRAFEVRMGLYATQFFALSQIAVTSDIAYSTRSNPSGQYTTDNAAQKATEIASPTLTMRYDVYKPPNASASSRQPCVVIVHGGGLVQGKKEDFLAECRTWARAGYVAVSINYRLTAGNSAGGTNTPLRALAVRQAAEDAMNAVRHLKLNAATYGIDTSRMVMIGSSSGGGSALTNAIQFDAVGVNDYPGFSSKVAAVITTGAQLNSDTGSIPSELIFESTDTPVLLFHAYPTDGTSGATWVPDVVNTAAAINASGNTCEVEQTANLGHVIDVSVDGAYWLRMYNEFLRKKLAI